MGSSDDSDSSAGGRRRKVVRLIDKYELHGIGEELERRWTSEGDDRLSLRELAEHFNRELLAAAIERTQGNPLAGEVANLYRLLTDEDVSDADRTRVRRRLEREGVPVDELESDFVTYQAIRGYLTEYRDVEYDAQSGDRLETTTESFQRLRGRTATVTESKLERLRNADDIHLGTFRTLVTINVICEDCGEQFELDELLTRGGCECPR